MPLYLTIQRVLLLGVHLPAAAPPGKAQPPAPVQAVVDAIAPTYQGFNQSAIDAGNRYRSAFWSIYLLSAAAVLCAVLPIALEWAGDLHLQEFMGHVWGVAEVAVMAVVGALVLSGRRNDWQGRWLAARTQAEMTWYLPLLAPLVPFQMQAAPDNWYARVFDGDDPFAAGDEIDALCRRMAPRASELMVGVWHDPQFVVAYGRWAAQLIDGQRLYHARLAARQRALLHRVHRINFWLFGLTAAGALAHLLLHAPWLMVLTIFCPALGASLHGALAQSEAYRLAVTSERLTVDLGNALQRIEAICGKPGEEGAGHVINPDYLQEAVTAAIALLLNEHQDWHMLVRPHHLPLA